MPLQKRLFDEMVTDAAAELAAERERRANAKERVLGRLQVAPATTVQLSRICLRFGARIKELRDEGYRIAGRKLRGNVGYVYSLQG